MRNAQAVIYGRREVSCMLKRPLPIGIEFYKEMIKKSYYYIDKTLMIKDILEKGGKVNLFTRPRRFGKSFAALIYSENTWNFCALCSKTAE